MFFSGLVLRIKIQKRWTSLTDYVDFCSVLHGLQIAEYSLNRRIYCFDITDLYGYDSNILLILTLLLYKLNGEE